MTEQGMKKIWVYLNGFSIKYNLVFKYCSVLCVVDTVEMYVLLVKLFILVFIRLLVTTMMHDIVND